MIIQKILEKEIMSFLSEDDLQNHLYYVQSLPQENVECKLYVKSPLLLSGLPFFFAVFETLGHQFAPGVKKSFIQEYEGKFLAAQKDAYLKFELPFGLALSAERLALNLLGHCSKISTYTSQFVAKAEKAQISIIDTRKTTPGLRSFEKYAVRLGGGFNHRLSQIDLWMVKDNHKNFFGGLTQAVDHFRQLQGFYTPIIVEIHSLIELKEAIQAEVRHVMLDNFSPAEIKQAVDLKPDGMSYEVSGGITLETLDSYLIPGVDAISVGRLTYGAPPVDLSFKYHRVH